jgi:hypothetical protein
MFAIVFVLIYVPLGMIIGFWHRKNQFSVEAEALFNQNQVGATIYLFLIDLIDGRVTEEEKQQMRRYLLKILKRPDRSPIVAFEGTEQETQAKPSPNDEKLQ